jgi:PKD repeat protein
MKNNPSVTDNGAEAVFVSADSKIRYISLNPPEQEEIISDQEYWDNVAISKDGNRLAAISTQVDTSIYVYDFTSRKWAKFRLYNPTTSHFNTDAGGVLYADAIEFDITGEYLIYDACNVLSSNVTEDIYYWDIGIIKVWDKAGRKFGDGSIFKLYGSLPENVSIGNPTFSQNSSAIIAFDYIDGNSGGYAILGTNLNTGETDVITENSTLGLPSFSKNDDRIAYTALTTSDEEVIAGIYLDQSKITGVGDPSTMIMNAKWPVYFASGERDLGLAPVSDFTADYKTGTAPLEVKYVDLSANDPATWKWTFEGGVPATSAKQNPYVVYNAPGTYRVILETRNEFGVNAITREDYITVSVPTGISGPVAGEFLAYPNPAGELLNIECETDFSFRLFDLKGEIILTGINTRQIGLSGIEPGFYILEMTAGNIVSRQKLLKK